MTSGKTETRVIPISTLANEAIRELHEEGYMLSMDLYPSGDVSVLILKAGNKDGYESWRVVGQANGPDVATALQHARRKVKQP